MSKVGWSVQHVFNYIKLVIFFLKNTPSPSHHTAIKFLIRLIHRTQQQTHHIYHFSSAATSLIGFNWGTISSADSSCCSLRNITLSRQGTNWCLNSLSSLSHVIIFVFRHLSSCIPVLNHTFSSLDKYIFAMPIWSTHALPWNAAPYSNENYSIISHSVYRQTILAPVY